MNYKQRTQAFVRLKDFLVQFLDNELNKDKRSSQTFDNQSYINNLNFTNFFEAIKKSELRNPWFIAYFIIKAIDGICEIIDNKNFSIVENKYKFSDKNTPKKIGVVLAGNIPLVGFHDFLCVLISGNIFVGKLSSKDDTLLKALTDILIIYEPEFKDYIYFEEQTFKYIDAVIATGSNNSSRYFEYYFSKYPHIIRKNRNSIAILTGNETPEQLLALSDDLFLYFGLGCRNVSKLYIPINYDIKNIFPYFEKYSFIKNHNKYINNHDYYKAIFLMNKINFLDNDFAILKQDNSISSPISVIHYEYYIDIEQVINETKIIANSLQCIVSNCELITNRKDFGKTQSPGLLDFADNVDTLQFLQSI